MAKRKKMNKRQRKKVAKLIFSLILLVIIIIAFVFFKDKIPFFNQSLSHGKTISIHCEPFLFQFLIFLYRY